MARLKATQALVERFGNENERLAGQIERMRTQSRTAVEYKGAHELYSHPWQWAKPTRPSSDQLRMVHNCSQYTDSCDILACKVTARLMMPWLSGVWAAHKCAALRTAAFRRGSGRGGLAALSPGGAGVHAHCQLR